jgi:hypothetical protein
MTQKKTQYDSYKGLFWEKNGPKSPDFEEFFSEIAEN